jgi:signal transduction histidine kinase
MRFKERAWIRVDWALAAVCALLVYGVMSRGVPYHTLYVFPLSLWLAGGWAQPRLAAVVAVPVGLRRRDPTGALLLALVGCSLIVAVGGQINRGPFLPLALTLYMVAATRSRTVAIASLAASLALLVVQGLILSMTGSGSGPATGVALILIIAWMVGISAQQRRAYTARVREQVATAAVTEERLRIARELHDVVAHSMTVVAVQAGFGEYVFEAEPEQARAALGNIQHVTREALSDMQRLLGVLRQDGTGQPGAAGPGSRPDEGQAAGPAQQLQLAPAPGLADLERLVSTTAGAGVRVDVSRTGEHRDVPAGIDQSAFRIVQEALTNVVKHSGASSCTVTVGYERAGLSVQITDPGGAGTAARQPHTASGGPNGTGHGILGMRERVGLCGGEFNAGPLPMRGFRVTARFPLPAQPSRAQPLSTAVPAGDVPAGDVPGGKPLGVRALPGQAR